MKKMLVSLVGIFLSCNVILAQEDNSTKISSEQSSFLRSINTFNEGFILDSVFSRLTRSRDPKEQDVLNDSIFSFLLSGLEQEQTFAIEFDSKKFGRVLSSDKNICIYSWNYYNATERMVFNMIVQTKEGKVYVARRVKAYIPDVFKTLPFSEWYGALYYNIEKFTIRKDDFYLLLGWSKVDSQTQIKVADVMYFKDGEIFFGSPMFTTDENIFHSRLIFRYDWLVQMSLDYNRKRKSIVFDHLAPMESSYPFESPRYAPDMSIDAYVKKSRFWKYKEDINIKNQ